MVAGFELADRRADLFHDPGPFVAQDGGRRPLPRAVDKMQVAVTDPRRRGADQDLAILRVVDFNLLNSERLVWTTINSRFSFSALPACDLLIMMPRANGGNRSHSTV